MNALPISKSSLTTDTLLSESDFTPLLTAWDQAHPAAASSSVSAVTVVAVDLGTDQGQGTDLDWRHVLDEIAHPHTTQAFHRLAEAAA
ncbi:hypothetical protein ACKI1I_02145 [Streptomyces turgidiscabies]|uniref:Uncharacterized protein n=1 Tax=Streptomyces turgidiscabies (strain Car8) TaxID=698760 RepID=L7F5V4_STRT8|nr:MULTISPECIES: hypothetical protein [Streptomyces]ELP66652.1 hypothetical protein STRTUCAR8_05380 [Streptomyces turgidiscabies Car8]MDX3492302.1 hypothetical protein [Streptomyces turgidiscabies]GAQ69406.1 hypothetical protein T45_01130 [Streptomyces turgidiscabies]